VQSHSVAPYRCPALHYHQRAAGDVWQRGQGLGGCDGRGDGDGVDYGGGHEVTTSLSKNNSDNFFTISGFLLISISASARISILGIIVQL